LVFVVEFFARVVLAERRVEYAGHVPDVQGVTLAVLRPLRLLRFLVLLRMINRRATASLHGRIVAYVVATAGLVLLISALAMLDAERHNPQADINTFGDALWWAVTTMSTVGYADRYSAQRTSTAHSTSSPNALRSGLATPAIPAPRAPEPIPPRSFTVG
jgi:voltage-gated potassium channel